MKRAQKYFASIVLLAMPSICLQPVMGSSLQPHNLPLSLHTSSTFQNQNQNQNPEEALYAEWFAAYSAKDVVKSLKLAKDYLAKFPAGSRAAYMKQYVAGATGTLFNEAMNAKNTKEMLRIGQEVLSEDKDNLDYLYLLVISLRQNELFALPVVTDHVDEVIEFSRRAITLVDADKIPNVVDKTKWDKNKALALLYQTLAVAEDKQKNLDQAIADYTKASMLDPTNAYTFLALGTIYERKYLAAAQQYQSISETDRQNPENAQAKAALEEVNKHADAVIETWSKFMALTADKSEYTSARDHIGTVLKSLAEYRNTKN